MTNEEIHSTETYEITYRCGCGYIINTHGADFSRFCVYHADQIRKIKLMFKDNIKVNKEEVAKEK